MLKQAFIFISLLLFCGQPLSAQFLIPLDEQDYLKQINSQIENSADDITRLDNYLLLSEYWAQSDSLKSFEALDFALRSPARDQLPAGLLEYYQGVFYENRGDKRTAKSFYRDAIALLEKQGQSTDILCNAWYRNAYVQVEDSGYDVLVKALTEKCIPWAEKHHKGEQLAYCYTQLGVTFMSVGQFDKAEQYHKKALAILDTSSTLNTVHLLTYFNLISNYCYKADSRTAKIYLDKATDLIRKYPESRHYPNYYYQLAMYYTTKQEFAPAVESMDKGIALAKQKKQYMLMQMLYFRKYNVFLLQHDYNRAKAILEQILEDNVLSKEAVNRKITFTQLASVNEALGDYREAYHWMKKSSALADSLQQQKLLEKMNESEILYQTAEKQQRIERLEQEKKENALIAKNENLRTTILGVALGLSMIIGFLVYLNYRNQQRLNRQIRMNHEQELLHIDHERKYEATQAILLGEEQERQRIAQDLHDSMGGMLANIRMSISSTDHYPASDILGKIDKSISEMRRISRNLMPETLKKLGLQTALREVCESMSHRSLVVQFESFDLSENIPFQTQLSLYRIVQEAISNVIKYAKATIVIVQISQNKDMLHLTIEDDGVGFDPSAVYQGMGLKNIESRVKLINGTLDVISAKGAGTTINIECHV